MRAPVTLVAAFMVSGALVASLAFLGAFLYLHARHRAFTRGTRGTALVVDVRPTSLVQRRSVVERPTETVVVATAAFPRGVPAGQKIPAGQYRVGEVVPVVQAPGDPSRLYLDRPDLERSALAVYSPLGMLLLVPLLLVLGLGLGRR